MVQLYLSFPDTAPTGTPKQVLRGFSKVLLQPGESTGVSFELLRRDVILWDVESRTWMNSAGEVEFRVGFSSRDVVQTITMSLID